MESRFELFPSGTYHPCCAKAVTILENAHFTASSFLSTFESERQGARGTTSDNQQDLLRAMLTFASSGLDSMIKQLVTDALPAVIDRREGAQEQFRKFVEGRLRRADGPDYSFVAGVMANPDPCLYLVGALVKHLTSRSLQSVEEVLRVGSYFDIPSPPLIPDPDATKKIFSARNEIVHEMDIDFERSNRNRRPRKVRDMTAKTNALFAVAQRFLKEVDQRLRDDQNQSP